MFRSIGIQELLIILAIILLLFGPKQIPKLSRMFGKAVKDVKEGFENPEEDEAKKTEALSDNEAVADASAPSKSESKAE